MGLLSDLFPLPDPLSAVTDPLGTLLDPLEKIAGSLPQPFSAADEIE